MNIRNTLRLTKTLQKSNIKRLISINNYTMTQINKQLSFTPKFYEAINDKLASRKSNSFLRLQIFAGEGCQGFQYKFRFDEKLDEQKDFVKSQTIINSDGKQTQRILFAVNGDQIKLLKGATIDFAQQMMRQIFYVKENPNAQIQCSCKTSFSPKEGLI